MPVTELARAAPRHPAAVYLARLGPGSRPAMACALETLADIASGGRVRADTFAWHEVDYALAQAVRTALGARYKPATANRHLAALRGVLREAWRLELMPAERYQRAIDLQSFRGETLPAGRALTAAELGALFHSVRADTSFRARRDHALLAVLAAGGLRRAEAAGLTRGDVADDAVRVVGKGGSERLVPLPPWAWEAVREWIDLWQGDTSAPLFRWIDAGGCLRPHALSTRAIAETLASRAAKAGIAACTPHDLRRTYVSELLDRGADIATVAALAGHVNVRVTQRYDRRGLEAKRKAAALLTRPGPA